MLLPSEGLHQDLFAGPEENRKNERRWLSPAERARDEALYFTETICNNGKAPLAGG
jgi:hypothetical protein